MRQAQASPDTMLCRGSPIECSMKSKVSKLSRHHSMRLLYNTALTSLFATFGLGHLHE